MRTLQEEGGEVVVGGCSGMPGAKERWRVGCNGMATGQMRVRGGRFLSRITGDGPSPQAVHTNAAERWHAGTEAHGCWAEGSW